MPEYSIVVGMVFSEEPEELALVKDVYAEAGKWSSLVRSAGFDGNTLTVTIRGEWRKYGAVRPLLEAVKTAVQPLEDYDREFYCPWPHTMNVVVA
jgi:hypothetical protein